MKVRSPALAAFAMAMAVAAPAFANADLAQKKNCMSCHAVDRKIVGPAYNDIAARYAADKAAVDVLAQKILKGGTGVWGKLVMPPMQNANPPVSDAEARQLATWILGLKK
ncbi:c-type cytochrome [Aquincola sp. MAHUQ-54]|uniref:C-type cytochrome n=1 Tax=Aquincola agrisoli TaxID=3119538 RepID=A0AAW9QIR9_9BURK